MFASSLTTSSSQITESDKVGVSILVSMYCIISSSTLPAYFIYVKTSHAEKNKLTVFIFIPSCPELISVTPEAATRGVLSKKMFLKMSEISQKKHLWTESLFNKVTGLQAYNSIKKRFQRRCFPVKFAKFSRITTLKNVCERLLLKASSASSSNNPINYEMLKAGNSCLNLTLIVSDAPPHNVF